MLPRSITLSRRDWGIGEQLSQRLVRKNEEPKDKPDDEYDKRSPIAGFGKKYKTNVYSLLSLDRESTGPNTRAEPPESGRKTACGHHVH
jgi:hypothetical protein